MVRNLAISIRVTPQNYRTQRIYRTAYNYDTRPEAEKELLDQFWLMVSTRYTDTPRIRVLRLISNLGF
jgi:deferrochelatase/peroxidase EfeB